MTDFDAALLFGAFLIFLGIGGLFADSWERRDARRRNRK
mgnify:CR=1 FL=1